MYKVLVTDGLDPQGVDILKKDCEVRLVEGLSQEELLDQVSSVHGLIVRGTTRVTGKVLDAGRNLRVVARAGVGLDNIDVAEAVRRGISVVNVPGANAVAVAELCLALLLSLARHIGEASLAVRHGKWRSPAHNGFELSGKTLGIVGLGRIGREVCTRALAFGMTVLAHDPYVPEETCLDAGARPVELGELLGCSDVITLHTPLTSETRGMIGLRELRTMKRGALLVNCARGGIVNEDALYDALVCGHLGGAGLDVFQSEPPGPSPLLSLPNVLATPHLGAATREARRRCSIAVAMATQRVLKGECLNPEACLCQGSHDLGACSPLASANPVQ
ncbi:MAG: hydroxyacid dehydrogenase [Bacillota bacterium]